MAGLDYLEVLGGALLVLAVLFDLFQSVVLPRPTPGAFRLTGSILRVTWAVFRGLALRFSVARREALLGSYAPAAVLLLLATWIVGLILGYGLMLHGLRQQLKPVPPDFETAVYASAISLLTIGFGDVVPVQLPARILVVLEGASGLGSVAMVISLLFTLYAAFQKREVAVVLLDASAGSPPSGIGLLENSVRYEMPELLPQVFADWRLWSAEVLESHLAYPILMYFRSTHDGESWVSALGAVMDAATLVMTALREGPRGQAKTMYLVGAHLVEDLTHILDFGHEHGVGIERDEFERACDKLERAGYLLNDRESAWNKFSELRSRYAGPLNSMANYWRIPPAQWIGDRSYLPHSDLRFSPGPGSGLKIER